MITCNFSGNFGNALIQYAITRTVAHENNYLFGFNPRFNYDYHNGYNQLDFLDLDYGIIHDASFHEMPEGIINIWEEKYHTMRYPNGDTFDWHPLQCDVFDIPDNTKLVVRCMQDARYYDKNLLRIFIKIKKSKEEEYSGWLKNNNISLDKNTCIINVRGGEYLGIPHVLLNKQYWDSAIEIMKELHNDNIKFIVVTDDPVYASKLFPNFKIIIYEIGMDYYILNNAKNLIISNSSFAIMPVWLNKYNPFVIAPKYWARHNISTGYWASSSMNTFEEWNWLGNERDFYEL